MKGLRQIERFPKYWFSPDGNVWSGYTPGSHRFVGKPVRKLKPSRSSHGYQAVTLMRDGIKHRVYVHALILEAFMGPCPRGMEACHDNGVRSDNRLENLRWDTRKGNHADKWKHGTQQAGERNGAHKLTATDVDAIRARLVAGESRKAIALDYDVHPTTISLISRGRKWAWLHSDEWEPTNKATQYTIDGEYRSLRYWAKKYGMPAGTLAKRVRRGIPLEVAVTLPNHKGRKYVMESDP